MPRPASDAVCSKTDPRLKCVWRWDASLRGEFLWDWDAQGWVWNILDGKVMLWDRCPGCKSRLPNQAAVYRRLREGIGEED
jgi:hypothetical protein